MITEVLREHEDGTGFTMTTNDGRRAFAMAEKMVFSGKKYSIKLGKEAGQDWVLVVDELKPEKLESIRPQWKDAPEWATHLIIKRYNPDAGQYAWAMYDGEDYKVGPDDFLCYHPDGYDHVEARP